MKKKFIRPEEKIVRDMITEEINKALKQFNKNVIDVIKDELKETLESLEKTQEKIRTEEDFEVEYDWDEGWVEGLRYALGCIDRKVAVNSLKEKDE